MSNTSDNYNGSSFTRKNWILQKVVFAEFYSGMRNGAVNYMRTGVVDQCLAVRNCKDIVRPIVSAVPAINGTPGQEAQYQSGVKVTRITAMMPHAGSRQRHQSLLMIVSICRIP
jgi:hypothetical protein